VPPHNPNCAESKDKLKRKKDYENPSEPKKESTRVSVVHRRFGNAINPMRQEDGAHRKQQGRPVVELNHGRIRHTISEAEEKPVDQCANQKHKADELEQPISG
jgi:hypothetical protein